MQAAEPEVAAAAAEGAVGSEAEETAAAAATARAEVAAVGAGVVGECREEQGMLVTKERQTSGQSGGQTSGYAAQGGGPTGGVRKGVESDFQAHEVMMQSVLRQRACRLSVVQLEEVLQVRCSLDFSLDVLLRTSYHL